MRNLLLILLFASVSFGQATRPGPILPLPPDVDNAIAGTISFQSDVEMGVTQLVTNVAPSIMPFGWTMLAIFGVYALLMTLHQSNLRQMSVHHYNPIATVVAYVAILFRILVATVMMSGYMVPILGLPFNFHQMFPYMANALATGIKTDLAKQVLGYFNDAIHFLPMPGLLQVMPAAVCVIVTLLIALSYVGMTIITSGSYSIVGLLTLCGPLMIPFYVLPGHEKKFWTWFDNILAYSMYVFVGSGMIYIFCFAYIDFFTNLHGWSIGNWIAHIPYMILITVVFLYSIFKVPDVSHIVFGGLGGVAQGFANSVQSAVTLGISKLLL